jgi:hypothetical protein
METPEQARHKSRRIWKRTLLAGGVTAILCLLTAIPFMWEMWGPRDPTMTYELTPGFCQTTRYWSYCGAAWFSVSLPGSLWLFWKGQRAWLCFVAGILCWLAPQMPALAFTMLESEMRIPAMLLIFMIYGPVFLLPLLGTMIAREILNGRTNPEPRPTSSQ